MFKKLLQQLKQQESVNAINTYATLPIVKESISPKNKYLNNLSKKAVELYERENDIQKFAKLAMSDPENLSHNDIVQELFKDGVVDPFLDDKLEMLADNKKLLKDLGLL